MNGLNTAQGPVPGLPVKTSRFYDYQELIRAARGAPVAEKIEWCCALAAGKEVLDLGVVDHTLDFCLHNPDRWLHGRLRQRASSLVGLDILETEAEELRKRGYEVITADAETVNLGRRFDVVVCGDLIEHVSSAAALLRAMARHLRPDGIGVITTPNPFAANRFFNVLLDGWTAINTEHVAWFCPQTLFQLADRCDLYIADITWLNTDYPANTRRRFWGGLANRIGSRLAARNRLMSDDFGIVVRKKPAPRQDLPFVSAILPTFNRAELLEEVLRSAAEQDYAKELYEIVVVDNGSADGTAEVVRRFAAGSPVDVLYVRETRAGLVFARHSGAARAKGEILAFGDDDAVYEKNWLSAIVDVYLRYPEVGAVGTAIEIRWDILPEEWVRGYEGYMGRLIYGDGAVVKIGLEINGGSFSIRKDVLYALGGFHPGQRGDYIVGDSETGLVRKLAAAGIPVGWTGATRAWHIQFREKNGTLRDLTRRLRNNGICHAYADTFYGRPGTAVVFRMARAAAAIARRLVSRLIRGDTKNLGTHVWLEINEYFFRLKYLFLYRFHRGIRGEIHRRDWELNDSYRAPAATEFPASGGGRVPRGPALETGVPAPEIARSEA